MGWGFREAGDRMGIRVLSKQEKEGLWGLTYMFEVYVRGDRPEGHSLLIDHLGKGKAACTELRALVGL